MDDQPRIANSRQSVTRLVERSYTRSAIEIGHSTSGTGQVTPGGKFQSERLDGLALDRTVGSG